MSGNFETRHSERDAGLPKRRNEILESAMDDLTKDKHVIGIYLGGSLAKDNFDVYSDIDLHIIVAPDRKKDFIKDKRNRSKNWGNVLFYEDSSAFSPVVVTHFDCFVKVDSWYHSPEDLEPSIWLKGLKSLYDPNGIIHKVLEESSLLEYKPSKEDVEFWRRKILAFIHETYRAVMRNEHYYALSNLDRIRWLLVSGWYMEMEQHLDGSYGIWSKLEGSRSSLEPWQLTLLESWDSARALQDIMKTMASMIPEFLILNRKLCQQIGHAEDEERIKRIIEMAF